MSINALVSRGYRVFVNIANHLQSPFLLLVRLYWGWQFAQAGWGKLHRLPKVTEFFSSLGIPAPHANAVFVSNLEVVGGILLAIGLGSRFISVLLAGDMLVAYLASDRDALRMIFSDPGKFYNADPYTFLFASLIILIFGPGLLSLDAFFVSVSKTGAIQIRETYESLTNSLASPSAFRLSNQLCRRAHVEPTFDACNDLFFHLCMPGAYYQ
jgi:putative oxidoreductase